MFAKTVIRLSLCASSLFLGNAYAQVAFNSVPVTNSCAAPWVITNTGCPPMSQLAPGIAKTLNCTSTGVTTPNGPFQWPRTATFSPGALCVFHNCTAASITLTCHNVASADAAAKDVDLVLKARKK